MLNISDADASTRIDGLIGHTAYSMDCVREVAAERVFECDIEDLILTLAEGVECVAALRRRASIAAGEAKAN